MYMHVHDQCKHESAVGRALVLTIIQYNARNKLYLNTVVAEATVQACGLCIHVHVYLFWKYVDLY